MSNGPKKITELPTAGSFANTDLLVLVGNTGATPTTYSITPAVLLSGTSGYTANNTNYVGSVTASNVVSNAQLSANLANYALLSGAAFTNTVSISNTLSVGNTSANVFIGYNSTDLTIAEFAGTSNNYQAIFIRNANSGTQSSADLTIYNDSFSTTVDKWIDMGIVSSNWSNSTWTIGNANDAYVYTGNSNLSIGANGANYINFFTGGTLITNERMRIDATGNVNIGNQSSGAASLTVGNTVTNVVINSTSVSIGSATAAANGFVNLPNGLKMNWGWVSSNSSVGAVTFTSPFTINAFSITATSNTAVATYGAAVTAWTKNGATILTANIASTNVFWKAIGQ